MVEVIVGDYWWLLVVVVLKVLVMEVDVDDGIVVGVGVSFISVSDFRVLFVLTSSCARACIRYNHDLTGGGSP